jgi:hypothetical protein
MIPMIVSRNEMIDLRQPSFPCNNIEDSLGVTNAGVSRVDKNRLALRCHDESGCATFYIHPVNIQTSIVRSCLSPLGVKHNQYAQED